MIFEVEGKDKRGPVRMRYEVTNQFDISGTWLRGNLHAHVDDMGNPQEVCDFYRSKGLDFLTSSDYRTITRMPPSDDSFVTLEGAELSGALSAHIVCVGLKEDISPPGRSLQELQRIVTAAHAQGGVTILAHSFRTNFQWDDLLAVARSGVVGFEVSNRRSWRINGKERSEALWELLIKDGVFLGAIGSDDSHLFEENVTGLTWTGLLVTERSPRGILDAVRTHRTYASEGPVLRSIRFDPQNARVVVDASPCSACHFRSKTSGVRSDIPASPKERFTLDLRRDGYRLRDWFYVCLEDDRGRRAWSSVIPVKNEIERLY